MNQEQESCSKMNTSLLVSTIRVHGVANREVTIVKWIAI